MTISARAVTAVETANAAKRNQPGSKDPGLGSSSTLLLSKSSEKSDLSPCKSLMLFEDEPRLKGNA